MKIVILGSNGMLSESLTRALMKQGEYVTVIGLNSPKDYDCSKFVETDFLKTDIDYNVLLESDIIIYASGAGVQAALSTPSYLMYSLNVLTPINITLELKKQHFRGTFISFGSYMEIGVNDNPNKIFTEDDVVCSALPVSNDYALSKRLFSRYMKDFRSEFTFWHFILPNMFSYNDKKSGTRLIPYVLEYCREYILGNNPNKPSFSPGTQLRQYILLEELQTIINKSIESNLPSGIYNVGGGEFKSIRNTIEDIFDYYKVPLEENYFGKSVRRDGDIPSLRISGDKLKSHINFLPSLKMTEALCDVPANH